MRPLTEEETKAVFESEFWNGLSSDSGVEYSWPSLLHRACKLHRTLNLERVDESQRIINLCVFLFAFCRARTLYT